MHRLWKQQKGSVVLEAALVLPFFLAFILLLVVFIRVSIAEMALQSAVSESTKVLAANMYPVELLVEEAKRKWDGTRVSGWLSQAVSQAESVRQKAVDAESFAEEYERWIPDPLIELMAWEKTKREQLEAWGGDMADEGKKQAMDKLAEAATPIVAGFADQRRLNPSRLKVTKLTFPDFENKEDAFVGIEAQYEFTFAVPFYRKTVTLRKHALERAWVGGAGS